MSPDGGGQPPGISPRPDRGSVAVQGLGFVLAPGGGGAVGVQDQGPALLVDHDLMMEPAQQHAVLTEVVPPSALCLVWCTWQAAAGWSHRPRALQRSWYWASALGSRTC